MAITLSELRIPEDRGKLGWCPLLSSQRRDSQDEGDDYELLEEFSGLLAILNQKARRSLYEDASEFIFDLHERFHKFFGAKADQELAKDKLLGLLTKVYGVESEAGGAPLGGRTLVVFMKLGRGVPYEVILKEEIDAQIAQKLVRPTQGHERSCKCIGCETRRTAVNTARKRVYRALTLRDDLGLTTRFMSTEQWQLVQKFGVLIRAAEARHRRVN